MSVLRWSLLKGGAVALVLLAGSFYAGCRVQASHDERVQALAKATADSTLAAVAAVHQRTVDSLAAEDAKAHAAAVAVENENARLRGIAAGHAARDRRKDSALAHARTAGDSLPIVVGQRDDARASYDSLRVADSTARAAAATELARRLDLAEKRRIADSTNAAARETVLREDMKGIALRLDRALNAKKLFGLVEVGCVAPGYGVVIELRSPVKVNHGAGAMCGVKIGLSLFRRGPP